MVAVSAIVPFLGFVIAPERWMAKEVVADVLGFLGIGSPSFAIPMMGVVVTVSLVLSAGLNVVMRRSINRFGAQCRKRLATDLAKGCTDAPYSWHIQRNAAILVRQINVDVFRWGNDFVTRILGSFQTISLLVLAVAFVLAVAPLPGIIGVGFAGLAAVISSRILIRWVARYSRTEKAKTDSGTISAQQFLFGIKDVKLSMNPSHFVNVFSDAFGVICDVQAKRNTLRQIMPLTMLFLAQSGMILVIIVLWGRDESPALIAEQVGFLAIIASRLVPALNRFSGELAGLWDSYPFSKSLLELKDEFKVRKAAVAVKETNAFPKAWRELTFEDVTYSYPNADRNALYPINFAIQRGRAYGLAGPSGAGKTTVVDLLLGLLDPTEGKICIDGLPISAIGKTDWQANLGYVPQRPSIIDDTLRGNVAFGVPRDEVDDELVWDCLALADLADLARDLPEGLDAPMGDRGVRLSGGQGQRVAIARALYKKPDILILDEATSALDALTERVVQNAIAKLRNRIATVTVAHRISTLTNCENIFLIQDGQMIANGAFDELLQSSPLFRKLAVIDPVARTMQE